MFYRLRGGQGVPWHKFGEGFDREITLEDVHRVLGTESDITVHSSFIRDEAGNEFKVSGQGVVMWEGRQIGLVGPNYAPLQNRDFVNSFKVWDELIDGKRLGEIETGGLLSGGSIIWLQVKLAIPDVDIRKDDPIRTYGMLTTSRNGSLGLVGGTVDERIVCRNTWNVAMSEGGFIRRKNVGDVQLKAADINGFVMATIGNRAKQVDQLRFLASKDIGSTKNLYKWVAEIEKKDPAIVDAPDFTPGKVAADVEFRLASGIGLGQSKTWWDALCAFNERVTHGEGNSLTDDRPGDMAARRLESMWFGTLQAQNQRAMVTALKHARA